MLTDKETELESIQSHVVPSRHAYCTSGQVLSDRAERSSTIRVTVAYSRA